MNILKKLAISTLISLSLFGAVPVVSASTLQGFQGGTGFASTSAANVGAFLQVASTSPFLTYTFATTTSGGGSVSTSSAITQFDFPYWATTGGALSGTSTLDFLNGSILEIQGNVSSSGYLQLGDSAIPATTTAGIRIFSTSTNGYSRPVYFDGANIPITLGRDNVFLAKNTSGITINQGQAVYISGQTGNVPNVALAQANATATLPAVGIVLGSNNNATAIQNNNTGYIMKLGVVTNINTSAFSAGDQVWVSTSTAGGLTNTRPTTPNFVQRIGSVLVSGVGNGSLLVTTAPFIGNEETGTSFQGTYLMLGGLNASGTISQSGLTDLTTGTGLQKALNLSDVANVSSSLVNLRLSTSSVVTFGTLVTTNNVVVSGTIQIIGYSALPQIFAADPTSGLHFDGPGITSIHGSGNQTILFSSTNRVGINNGAPLYMLDVKSTSSFNGFQVSTSSSVPIFTVSATGTVQVMSNNLVDSNSNKYSTSTVSTSTFSFGVSFSSSSATQSPPLRMPFGGTIFDWKMSAGASCSGQYDVWKAAGAIPTKTNTIVGTDFPTLTSQTINSSTALTGWTKTFSAGDYFIVSATSTATTCNNGSVQLDYIKN